MEDLQTNWGATLPLVLEDSTGDAAEAEVIIADEDLNIILTKTVSFADGSADISLTAEEMGIEPGDYYWQINIRYTSGKIDKFPNPEQDGCDSGDCEYKVLTVCPTTDMEES